MSIHNEVKNIAVLLRNYGALFFFLHNFTKKYFPRRTGGLAKGVVSITDSEMYFRAKFVVPENPFSNVGCICIVGVFSSK